MRESLAGIVRRIYRREEEEAGVGLARLAAQCSLRRLTSAPRASSIARALSSIECRGGRERAAWNEGAVSREAAPRGSSSSGSSTGSAACSGIKE